MKNVKVEPGAVLKWTYVVPLTVIRQGGTIHIKQGSTITIVGPASHKDIKHFRPEPDGTFWYVMTSDARCFILNMRNWFSKL